MPTAVELFSGTLYLSLRCVFGLAVVGAVSRTGFTRAWWLGFAVLGWIYLDAAFAPDPFEPSLPTQMLLSALGPHILTLLKPIAPPELFYGGSLFVFWHCLWAVLAASSGGFLARTTFIAMVHRQDGRETRSASVGRRRSVRWIGEAVLYSSCLALVVLVVARGVIGAPRLWAGLTFLLTWALIGLMVLRASFGRGNRRVRSLAASLLGASILILAFGRTVHDPWPISPIVELLDDIRPWVPTVMSGYPAGSEVRSAVNAPVHKALEREVRMHFVDETPLDDVLTYVKDQTADADGNRIRVEVGALAEGGVNLVLDPSVRMIDLDGVPLVRACNCVWSSST
jgi:hypothetical protein